ncbi:MAG: hypothetical protein K1X57_06910 [Gemmataceae bacterium]|nr:hypothetical protein [Gemmataceae bacterium]
MADSPLLLVFIPALAPLLVRAEDLKGLPLNEAEVMSIRDNAVCVALPPDAASAVEAKRGYRDINPDDCWAKWTKLRIELGRGEPTVQDDRQVHAP